MRLAETAPAVDYAGGVELLRWLLLGITILIGIALLVLILVGWRRRTRRHAGLPPLGAAPALPEDAPVFAGKYVATTTAGDPYDRIAADGLGFRGSARVVVDAAGLLIERTGEPEVWIPRDALVGVDRATWTIDRVVEEDGLQLVRWRLGDREVDTYLRMDEPRALDAAIERLELIKHA